MNCTLGRTDFAYGHFGENFTIDGLPDAGVCIGDRYRIGSALFEVTQPRVTCYRVGIRMNEPQMAALLVAHHRPGFYFRVLEEGEVEAGDEIVKVMAGPERLTVAETDALLYLPGHDKSGLERALRIPALSAGWRSSFNLALRWDSAFQSLLELAEACDVPVRWSCRTGVCHNCETGLIAGTVDYLPDPVEPPGDGNLLICCSRPRADIVLDL